MIPILSYPCDSKYVTSPYGERLSTADKFHDGTDFRGAKGNPVYAVAAGNVISARVRAGYGNYLIIDHGSFQTAYAHLNDFTAKVGDYVKRGHIIGHIGSTGTKDTHLHFEVREGAYNAATYFDKTGDKFNNSVNPMLYLSDELTPEEIIAMDTDSPEFWNRWLLTMRRVSEVGGMSADDFSTIVAASEWIDDLIKKLHNHGN